MLPSQTTAHHPQRRRWPLAEKRRIVELTLQDGASIQSVAREYRLHATTLSHWKAMYIKGSLDASHQISHRKNNSSTHFLPVVVDTSVPESASSRSMIAMTLPNGMTVRMESNFIDLTTLATFITNIQS